MRNIVVTGGSRGLGLGIATMLAQGDVRVIAIARSLSPALEKATAAQRDNLHFLAWDLFDVTTLPDLANYLRDAFGPIYGLVNNAGIGTPGILSTMPVSQIERLVQMNILSPIMLTRQLVRPMMAARAGRIINMASIVASTGYSGLSVYGATKAALVGFTRSLAREVGSLGITVNAVAPGFIDTEMTHELGPGHRDKIARRSALQRMATTTDVASAVDFLMSDRAANITGTVMTVDAGGTA